MKRALSHNRITALIFAFILMLQLAAPALVWDGVYAEGTDTDFHRLLDNSSTDNVMGSDGSRVEPQDTSAAKEVSGTAATDGNSDAGHDLQSGKGEIPKDTDGSTETDMSEAAGNGEEQIENVTDQSSETEVADYDELRMKLQSNGDPIPTGLFTGSDIGIVLIIGIAVIVITIFAVVYVRENRRNEEVDG